MILPLGLCSEQEAGGDEGRDDPTEDREHESDRGEEGAPQKTFNIKEERHANYALHKQRPGEFNLNVELYI